MNESSAPFERAQFNRDHSLPPEHFEKVKSGAATITQIKREIKEEQREARREENRVKVASVKSPQSIV